MEIKERILQVSEELFSKFGIRSVTMDDIAKALGMSKKTIYQHFSDKDAIVNAVATAYMETDKQEAECLYQNAADPIDEFIQATEHMKKRFSGINPVLFNDLQKYYPQTWKSYEKHKDIFLKIVLRNLQEGIEKGFYRSDIEPNILAKYRIESMDMIFDGVFPYTEFEYMAVIQQLTEHYLQGILTEKGRERFALYRQHDT